MVRGEAGELSVGHMSGLVDVIRNLDFILRET